ncbi:hypothetical protein Tco_0036073, partial [Tanacetum coccineum]
MEKKSAGLVSQVYDEELRVHVLSARRDEEPVSICQAGSGSVMPRHDKLVRLVEFVQPGSNELESPLGQDLRPVCKETYPTIPHLYLLDGLEWPK